MQQRQRPFGSSGSTFRTNPPETETVRNMSEQANAPGDHRYEISGKLGKIMGGRHWLLPNKAAISGSRAGDRFIINTSQKNSPRPTRQRRRGHPSSVPPAFPPDRQNSGNHGLPLRSAFGTRSRSTYRHVATRADTGRTPRSCRFLCTRLTRDRVMACLGQMGPADATAGSRPADSNTASIHIDWAGGARSPTETARPASSQKRCHLSQVSAHHGARPAQD